MRYFKIICVSFQQASWVIAGNYYVLMNSKGKYQYDKVTFNNIMR